MITTNEIIIPLSKKKTIFLLLVDVVFVAVCLKLLTQDHPDSILFAVIIPIIGMLLFGSCGIYMIIKFFDKKPGLIINNEGIIDNSSAISAGLIKWGDITNINIKTIYDQEILTIGAKNAGEIITRQKGLKKVLMALNKKFYNSPIQISSSMLKCNFQELYNTIKKQLAIHRKKTNT